MDTRLPVKFACMLILGAAATAASANEDADTIYINGQPCGSFCRSWMGIPEARSINRARPVVRLGLTKERVRIDAAGLAHSVANEPPGSTRLTRVLPTHGNREIIARAGRVQASGRRVSTTAANDADVRNIKQGSDVTKSFPAMGAMAMVRKPQSASKPSEKDAGSNVSGPTGLGEPHPQPNENLVPSGARAFGVPTSNLAGPTDQHKRAVNASPVVAPSPYEPPELSSNSEVRPMIKGPETDTQSSAATHLPAADDSPVVTGAISPPAVAARVDKGVADTGNQGLPDGDHEEAVPSMVPPMTTELSKAGGRNDQMAAMSPALAARPDQSNKSTTFSPLNGDPKIAIIMTGLQITTLADLKRGSVAIDSRQSAAQDHLQSALAAAGASGIQLSDSRTKALDRLISGEVAAAVLALVSPSAANNFPDIAGYKIFRLPLSSNEDPK